MLILPPHEKTRKGMEDIYMNFSNSTTKFYMTLELIIMSKLIYPHNFEMHSSANMISLNTSLDRKNIYITFFIKAV